MLVNYFLFLSVLLMISGLALDSGLLAWRQVHLQNAADAAAQEAVYQYARGDSGWSAEGKSQATANGFTDGTNGASVSVVSPPTSTVWAGDPWSVQATVSQSVGNIFMSLAGAPKSTVAATAVGRILPTCVWIMNPNGPSSGGSFWLASAGMTAPCGLYVNTSSGGSMSVDGFATLRNLRTRVVGASTGNNSSGTVFPQPKFGAAAKNDPLAYITAPTFTSCTYTGGVSLSGGSYTVGPGTYCGGFSLSSTSVTLTSGLYIITGGVSLSNSYLYGTSGVTLYFTQGGGYGLGGLTISGSSSSSTSGIYLKAPTTSSSGGIPGIVLFGDRNWISHGSQGVRITYTQVYTDGIWYFLNTGVYLWQSPFTFYNYNGVVADNWYQFGASSSFQTNYSGLSGGVGPYGGSPYHYEDGVLVY